jgi:hypothetical protein
MAELRNPWATRRRWSFTSGWFGGDQKDAANRAAEHSANEDRTGRGSTHDLDAATGRRRIQGVT